MSRTIYLDAPNLGKLEKKYLNKAIDSNYVSTIGPFVPEFEEKFKEYIATEKAVSVQSGTEALRLALYQLDIKQGDEVIIPALTFVATINAVLYVGATPVFADIDQDSWNIDPGDIERKITNKTKAIIPVHLYGNPCNMERIANIADRNDIFIVEDATESLGALYKTKHTGTIGDFGCFSFNGNKIITTGGGGMIVGKNEDHLEHIKFLVNQTKGVSNKLPFSEMGFNSRMTNLEAALGLAQIERLGEFLKRKRIYNDIYRDQLKPFDFIKFQHENVDTKSSYWFTSIMFNNNIDIAKLQDELFAKNIATRRVFEPLPELPAYTPYKKDLYNNSNELYKNGLCLPSSTLNSEDDIHFVCKVLKELI